MAIVTLFVKPGAGFELLEGRWKAAPGSAVLNVVC